VKVITSHLVVGESRISPSTKEKNLGSWLDRNFDMITGFSIRIRVGGKTSGVGGGGIPRPKRHDLGVGVQERAPPGRFL